MKFNKKILSNGLRIITVPMKDNPTVTVMVLVEAGSKYEIKEQNGLSHFLEHMCFKGTVKRPKAIDISRELDSIGAEYNAFTSQEFTGYYAKSDFKHAGKLIDVVSDMYLNPTLPESEIEKEKGVIVEEINMYEDMPQRHIQDLFMKLLYGDQPAGWNVAGTKEIVKKLTREEFSAYRGKHYVAKATTVIVAGKIEPPKAEKTINDFFLPVNNGEKGSKVAVVEEQKLPRFLIEHKETDQTHLVLGVRTFDIYDRQNQTMRLLQGVLSGGMSSRLFQKLRDEMGVCYYVSAGNEGYTDHGSFQVAAGVDSGRVHEVIKVILAELKRLAEEEVSPAELKKVKDYLIGSLYLGLESSDELAQFFGYQEILRKRILLPDEIEKEINAVGATQIKELAGNIFKNSGLNLAIIGRFKSEHEFSKELSF